MLRSLVRTENEKYPAWPSIEEGLEAKRELERCRDYYEHQLLPMSLGTSESKVRCIWYSLRGLCVQLTHPCLTLAYIHSTRKLQR